MREDSEPVDEKTRQASRAEALAKLTTPTPTAADIFCELDAFPFPVVGAAPDAADITTAVRVALRTEKAISLSLPRPFSDSDDVHAPPPLLRAHTVDTQPKPVPLDIDLRGRLVRARNAPKASSSSGLTISSTSSASPALSLDWPSSSVSHGSSASDHTVSTRDEHFSRGPPRAPYAVADKRAAESAIDVLAVVAEDVANSADPRLPPKTSLKRRSTQRRNRTLSVSERMPAEVSEGSLELPKLHDRSNVLKPLRPYRLVPMGRSFSSGLVTEPTSSEKELLGARSRSGPFANADTSALGRTPSTALPVGRSARPLGQQRFFSDPSLEGVPPRIFDDVGAPPPVRARHESCGAFAAGSSSAGRDHEPIRRWSATPTVRTKLVVREEGKASVTYVRIMFRCTP